MRSRTTLLACALAASLLSACGGGDSNSDTAAGGSSGDAADKYVGTWDIPCLVDGSISGNGVVTMNKTGANALSGSSTVRAYTNTSCSGAAVGSTNFPASLTVDGQGTASGKSVDKVTFTALGDTGKDVFYVDGNKLYSSPDSSPKDGAGYPTQLDMGTAFTRR